MLVNLNNNDEYETSYNYFFGRLPCALPCRKQWCCGEYLTISTPQHLTISTPQHLTITTSNLTISTPQHLTISTSNLTISTSHHLNILPHHKAPCSCRASLRVGRRGEEDSRDKETHKGERLLSVDVRELLPEHARHHRPLHRRCGRRGGHVRLHGRHTRHVAARLGGAGVVIRSACQGRPQVAEDVARCDTPSAEVHRHRPIRQRLQPRAGGERSVG